MEQKNLINVLLQGKEVANQLSEYLNPSSSKEAQEVLIEKLLSSYEKALSMLKRGKNCPTAGAGESSHTDAGTIPWSIDLEPGDITDQCQKTVFKKRKTMPERIERVRINPEAGLEVTLDDGYSWRKYGQKGILGANFPRAYYRCTHQYTQNCSAKKLVQKSDEDSTILEITYRGNHTCKKRPELASTGKEEPTQTVDEQKILLDAFKLENSVEIFPYFPFQFENEEIYSFPMEKNLMDDISTPFLSTSTSESNYFTFAVGQNMPTSESDHTEIISGPNSVTNSPIGDFNFSLDHLDFDPNMQFDGSEFLV